MTNVYIGITIIVLIIGIGVFIYFRLTENLHNTNRTVNTHNRIRGENNGISTSIIKKDIFIGFTTGIAGGGTLWFLTQIMPYLINKNYDTFAKGILLYILVGAFLFIILNKIIIKLFGERNEHNNRRQNKWIIFLIILFILAVIFNYFNVNVSWFIIFIIGLLLLYKYITFDTMTREVYLKLFELVIVIGVVGFISNELISPLVSPRVSDIKITPLYIQSEDPNYTVDRVTYYTLFDITYEIELPYFLINDKLNLRLPGKQSYENIQVITSFQENNPFYKINLPDELLEVGSFLSYAKIDGIVPIVINTNSGDIKKIQVHLIIREKNDLHYNTIESSSHYWWTHTTIYPIKSTGNEVTSSSMSLIGYGLDQYGNYHKFYDLIVKSLTDLEIKGLRIPVGETPIFCDEGIKLEKEFDKYLSIDLKPREIKHILGVSQVIENRGIRETNVVFNFSSETDCFGQWLKYKELSKLS